MSVAVLIVGLCSLRTHSATFSWDSGSAGADWSVPGNWAVTGGDGDGIPDSDDTISTPTTFGVSDVNFNATAGAFEYDSASSWDVISQGVPGRTLDIIGNLTKSGSGTLQFRESGAGDLQVTVGGNLLIQNGLLEIGDSATDESTLNVTGSATIDGRLSFRNIGSSRSIGGILTLNGTGRLDMVGHGEGGSGNGTMAVGGLSSASSSTLIANNGNSISGYNGFLVLNNSSGVTTYAGEIADGSNSGAPNVLNVEKNNAGTQVFSGNAIHYSGTTTINGGRLDINGTSSGQGAYTVNSGGTVGGHGTIGLDATSITVNSGGAIAAGDTTTPVGTLTVLGGLILADGTIFDYDLNADGPDDLLDVGSVDFGANLTLNLNNLGTGAITPSDEFILLTSVSIGTLPTFSYTQGSGPTIDTSGATVNQVGNDLILSGLSASGAVPEPGTVALIVLGGFLIRLRQRMFGLS